MWSLPTSLAVTLAAAFVIAVAGRRLVLIADHIADRTGVGEALIGATLLGATTSLADITAVTSAAWDGFGSMAVSAAVGGIAVQTLFLAMADMRLRQVNLEHAAASLPNMISVTLLILNLSLLLMAALGPRMTLWHLHPVTFLLFITYGLGLRLVLQARETPMWRPEMTRETRLDTANENAAGQSWPLEIVILLLSAGSVAVAGWALSNAGEGLLHHLGLTETAVGALVIAVGTSLPELVTSIAAVRCGALTLAVGGIIGGNAFDTLMVGLADIAYRDGSIYQDIVAQDLVLTTLTLFMSAVLLLGLFLRQRKGPANVGFEGAVIIAAYAVGLFLVNLEY